MAKIKSYHNRATVIVDNNFDVPLGVYSSEFTRPNDTNAYAAGDCVATSTSAPVLQSITVEPGMIVGAKLVSGKTGGTIPAGSFRLRLYNASITQPNDNAVIPMLWANRTKSILDVTFNCVTGGSGSDAVADKQSVMPILNQGTTIYYLIESLGAYTPVELQGFYVELSIATF